MCFAAVYSFVGAAGTTFARCCVQIISSRYVSLEVPQIGETAW